MIKEQKVYDIKGQIEDYEVFVFKLANYKEPYYVLLDEECSYLFLIKPSKINHLSNNEQIQFFKSIAMTHEIGFMKGVNFEKEEREIDN